MNFLAESSLKTKRLKLRHFVHDDWKSLHEYFSDIDCMKYTLGRTLTEGESWLAMSSMVGHWDLHGYGPYGIELVETKKLIGICGLWYPNDWPEPEIKWGLIKKYWGKGYAKEAAIAVKIMSQRKMPDMSLISLIFEGNKNSINLALSLGANYEKEIEFRNKKARIYRHI